MIDYKLIRDKIIHIENHYPVDKWEINGIQIWPFIRIKLCLFLWYDNPSSPIKNTTRTGKKNNFFNKLTSRIRSKTGIIKRTIWLKKLPIKDNLFIGHNSHRVDYKNKKFNRFFDLQIENQSLNHNSILFECGSSPIIKLYNNKIIKSYQSSLENYLYNKYNSKKTNPTNSSLDFFNDFLEYLHINETESLVKKFSLEKLNEVTKILSIKTDFFILVLEKIKPKKIYILCYYTDDNMCLINAANLLGIQTIEVQHGPQTDTNMCYSHWTKIPALGFNPIPKTFWCWDDASSSVILKWAQKSNIYSSLVVGNFWVDYWKGKNYNYFEKKFILYTLQIGLTLDELFPLELINIIKNNDIKWFMRLHPRQSEEKEKIISLFRKFNIMDKIDIENATKEFLPILLSNCLLHVTHHSGSALEASYFNKKTIILNKIGEHYFDHLIEKNQAYFIEYSNPDLQKKFNEILNQIVNQT